MHITIDQEDGSVSHFDLSMSSRDLFIFIQTNTFLLKVSSRGPTYLEYALSEISAVLELRWYSAERISISLSTTTASLTFLLLDDLCACLRLLLDDVGAGCIAAKLRCRVRKVAATKSNKNRPKPSVCWLLSNLKLTHYSLTNTNTR